MTAEQIKQNAEDYAWKKIQRTSDKQFTQALVEAYISGAHSRDEEVKGLYSNLEHFRSIINNLRNPWISGEKHPTDVTKNYLLEYEDGSYIVAMWDSSMWISKDLHPLKDPKKWMYIP